MPRYTSKKKRGQKRNRERIRHAIPRDRRHLLQWAVDGTDANYEQLRQHATSLIDQVPSYIDKEAVAAIASGASRETMVDSVIKEKKSKGNWFTDALSWLIDQVPNDWEVNWLKDIGQAVLKPYRGSNITEEDEVYAQLVDQSYKSNKPEEVGDWTRVPEFDSEYMNVWDNVDGHRFIGVRGTEISHLQDLEEDYELIEKGKSDDLLSGALRDILDKTKPGTNVDVGAHSLGTSLLATAFETDDSLQDRIRQTYWYNPVFSPIVESNVTDKYEADDRVRYFIDLMDLASIGDLGSQGPSNVVYRTKWSLNPLEPHKLSQWFGNVELNEQQDDPAPPQQFEHVVEPSDESPQTGLESALGPGVLLDFGDTYDPSSLGFG